MTRPELPASRRAVSADLSGRLQGASEVRAYYDATEGHVVAVVEAMGTPHQDLATFATASLHAVDNWVDDRDIRIELLMVGAKELSSLGNLVATAAFYVVKDRWLAAPGVVFPDLVAEYYPTGNVRHLMWAEPFDFEGLSTFSVDDLDYPIHALQGVPITDREYDLLLRDGYFALETALEAAGVEHFDFSRESAV